MRKLHRCRFCPPTSFRSGEKEMNFMYERTMPSFFVHILFFHTCMFAN